MTKDGHRTGAATTLVVLVIAGVLALTATIWSSLGDPAPEGREHSATPPLRASASPGQSAGQSAGQSSEAPRSPGSSRSSAGSPPPGPALLFPDMRSLAARDLQVERTDSGRRLRFAAALGNLGPGPMLLRPLGRRACPRGQHAAVQLVLRDRDEDGRYRRRVDTVSGGERRDVGCMLRHPRHSHWHFDAMARYALRDPDTGEVVAARDKVSFCLRDNERVPGVRTTVRREHFGECRRRSRQGISPGWVDVYDADLDGQTLRLPRGLDGALLCLDLDADPRDQLLEADESNNATSVGIRVDGLRVRRASSTPCR